VFVCPEPECCRDFWKKSLLTEHRKSHAATMHACSRCDRTYKTARGLKDHEATHDQSRPRFACNVPGCTKNYSSPRNLDRHVQASHPKPA
jgi:uncharacterized Zn-finger protein